MTDLQWIQNLISNAWGS